ncbi:O-acetyltransferase OatA [compost metagenome]
MKFRYDIGFLRAIAVLIVVFFHYQIPLFKGGFIGVDVFFVISGFLMTSIILKGFDRGFFSVKEFYMRRFVRIVPALYVMMFGIMLLAFFLYFPTDYEKLSRYALFSSVFLSNYYYLFNSGYFDASSQSNVLLHTWSLSVEWQFYIFYPIFLLVIRKFYIQKTKRFNLIFLITILISFLLVIIFNNFLPSSYNKISFFSFTHRAWEMMFGGLAFLYKDFFDTRISNRIKQVLTFISLSAIGLSVVYFNEKDAWPSFLTLIPVFASFLLIAINKDYNFYRNSKVQYIGTISYSWYLLHWPIYVIFKYFDYGGIESTLIMLVISFALAALSYEYIEKRANGISLKTIYIGSTFVIIISLVASFFRINDTLFSSDSIIVTEFKDKYEKTRKKQFNSGVCHNVIEIDYRECLCIDANKKNVLLIGDSHAGQFSLSFRTKLDSKKYNFMEHTVVGSFPLISAKGEKKSTTQFRTLFDKFIKENNRKIDMVILSCNWTNYPTSAGYSSNDELASGINATIESLEKLGIKVLVIGQGEEYNIDYPRVVAFELSGKKQKTYINDESVVLNNDLKKKLPAKNYVNIFLSNEIQHYDVLNKVPYMFDDDHLTIYGANQVVDFIIKKRFF